MTARVPIGIVRNGVTGRMGYRPADPAGLLPGAEPAAHHTRAYFTTGGVDQ